MIDLVTASLLINVRMICLCTLMLTLGSIIKKQIESRFDPFVLEPIPCAESPKINGGPMFKHRVVRSLLSPAKHQQQNALAWGIVPQQREPQHEAEPCYYAASENNHRPFWNVDQNPQPQYSPFSWNPITNKLLYLEHKKLTRTKGRKKRRGRKHRKTPVEASKLQGAKGE